MAGIIETPDSLEYVFSPLKSFELTVSVKAPHDAHIALAPGATDEGGIIEIFLGGWEGAKSAIRLNKEKPDLAQVDSPDIVSADEERTFVVRWNTDGLVQVSLQGALEPFLSAQVPTPFPITHFGLKTSWGASGEWKIDGVKEVQTADTTTYEYFPVHGGNLVMDIQAASNAHIALTSGPAEEAPIYEIFLGGWDNTKSAIRLHKEKPDKAEAATEQIVTDAEFRRFIIKWNYAAITVRRSEDEEPILSFANPEPHAVTHYGIRTGWGATGQWQIQAEGAEIAAVPIRTEREAPAIEENIIDEVTEENVVTTVTEGAVSWVSAGGGAVPEGSLVGGNDHGEEIIVARAAFEGALLPGKLVAAHGVAYVPWGGEEHGLEEYETLVVPADAVSWVPTSGGEIPANAIPGGTTIDGETLYIGRVPHEDTLTTGKVHPSHATMYISYGGAEIGYPEYEILVLN